MFKARRLRKLRLRRRAASKKKAAQAKAARIKAARKKAAKAPAKMKQWCKKQQKHCEEVVKTRCKNQILDATEFQIEYYVC